MHILLMHDNVLRPSTAEDTIGAFNHCANFITSEIPSTQKRIKEKDR